jgi:hypothetical protein
MQPQHWKDIEKAAERTSQPVSLNDSDRALLDKVQSRLALNDSEFLQFLALIGRVSPNTARLIISSW